MCWTFPSSRHLKVIHLFPSSNMQIITHLLFKAMDGPALVPKYQRLEMSKF
jgi:hypothetical protein